MGVFCAVLAQLGVSTGPGSWAWYCSSVLQMQDPISPDPLTSQHAQWGHVAIGWQTPAQQRNPH
jgi:hypothetical protein